MTRPALHVGPADGDEKEHDREWHGHRRDIEDIAKRVVRGRWFHRLRLYRKCHGHLALRCRANSKLLFGDRAVNRPAPPATGHKNRRRAGDLAHKMRG